MSPAVPRAPGTLVFLQGTGDPNPVPAETLRSVLPADPVLAGYTVLNVAWASGAVPDLSVVPALPPRYRQAGAASPTGPEDTGPDSAGAEIRYPLAAAGLDLLSAGRPLIPPQPAGNPVDNSAAEGAAPEAKVLEHTLERLVLGVVTDVAVRRRVPLTESASDFSRSIIFYLRRGAQARSAIVQALRTVDQDAPVILFGHSLGGIAAVDLVTGSQWQDEKIRVDLLVTAGSQSPWLYLLGGLAQLGPDRPGKLPVPWLNFWDERDLLSFCAEEVFAGRGVRIIDREVASGEPFPQSHDAYFANPELIREIRVELEAVLGV